MAHSTIVQSTMQQLKLKQQDREMLRQSKEPVIILFKGYEQTQVYDNLFVKNQLNRWTNAKVIVTCNESHFQHRGYTDFFLNDPSNPQLSSLSVYRSPKFIQQEAQQKLQANALVGKKRAALTHNPAQLTLKHRAKQQS